MKYEVDDLAALAEKKFQLRESGTAFDDDPIANPTLVVSPIDVLVAEAKFLTGKPDVDEQVLDVYEAEGRYLANAAETDGPAPD
jgi:hypothetical protein